MDNSLSSFNLCALGADAAAVPENGAKNVTGQRAIRAGRSLSGFRARLTRTGHFCEYLAADSADHHLFAGNHHNCAVGGVDKSAVTDSAAHQGNIALASNDSFVVYTALHIGDAIYAAEEVGIRYRSGCREETAHIDDSVS